MKPPPAPTSVPKTPTAKPSRPSNTAVVGVKTGLKD